MKKEGYFVISGIVLLNAIVLTLFFLNEPWVPISNFDYFFVRLFSLLGLVALFVSSMFSLFTKELYQIFQKSFIKIHHTTAISGIVLMLLHPIMFALEVLENLPSAKFVDGLKVFLPDFTSAYDFWRLAGRPALYIFAIAVIGALIRRSFKKGWRYMHWLNYIGFAFVVIHGIMNGSDFYPLNGPIVVQNLIMTILAMLMFVAVIVVFIMKRVQTAKRKQKRIEQEEPQAAK